VAFSETDCGLKNRELFKMSSVGYWFYRYLEVEITTTITGSTDENYDFLVFFAISDMMLNALMD
jgi:hypothetical protein